MFTSILHRLRIIVNDTMLQPGFQHPSTWASKIGMNVHVCYWIRVQLCMFFSTNHYVHYKNSISKLHVLQCSVPYDTMLYLAHYGSELI